MSEADKNLESKPRKKIISIRADLLKLPESPSEKAYLIGTECQDCGMTFSSKRYYCGSCTSGNMKEIALSNRGKLDTYTISRMTPPGSVMQAPYALGVISLPGGARITAVLTECDFETLDIGMDMELVVEKVKEDERGNDIISFKFRPA